MSGSWTQVLLAVLTAGEIAALYLLGAKAAAVGVRWLPERGLKRLGAWALLAPGTVLHELSHVLACWATGTRVRSVTLFRPRREGGTWILGRVTHDGPTSAFAGLLIAMAPLLLVPAFIYVSGCLLLHVGVGCDPLTLLGHAGDVSHPQTPAWWLLALLGGAGTVPSSTDHRSAGSLPLLIVLLAVIGAGVGAALTGFSGPLTDVEIFAAEWFGLPCLLTGTLAATIAGLPRLRQWLFTYRMQTGRW